MFYSSCACTLYNSAKCTGFAPAGEICLKLHLTRFCTQPSETLPTRAARFPSPDETPRTSEIAWQSTSHGLPSGLPVRKMLLRVVLSPPESLSVKTFTSSSTACRDWHSAHAGCHRRHMHTIFYQGLASNSGLCHWSAEHIRHHAQVWSILCHVVAPRDHAGASTPPGFSSPPPLGRMSVPLGSSTPISSIRICA